MEPEGGIYGFAAPLLDGGSFDFGQLRGRVVLIVNTASKCGFTPQYEGLEKLYRAYADRGLAVLGFPSNQFGGQEPGSAAEIGSFCQRNYGVTFPIFAKIDVNGPNAHPLYQFLKSQRSGFFGMRRISWNFAKFLVDRKGNVAGRFGPRKRPRALTAEIERLLAKAE
jgi:glutathione peroxidase